jgi:hypothetical protein
VLRITAKQGILSYSVESDCDNIDLCVEALARLDLANREAHLRPPADKSRDPWAWAAKAGLTDTRAR